MTRALLALLLALPLAARAEPDGGFWDVPRIVELPQGAVVVPFHEDGGLGPDLFVAPPGGYANKPAVDLMAQVPAGVNTKLVIALSFAAGIVTGTAAAVGVYQLTRR